MDRRTQINALCTEIGVIMEDWAPAALLMGQHSEAQFDEQFAGLVEAIGELHSHLRAIKNLMEQS